MELGASSGVGVVRLGDNVDRANAKKCNVFKRLNPFLVRSKMLVLSIFQSIPMHKPVFAIGDLGHLLALNFVEIMSMGYDLQPELSFTTA